MCNFIQDPLAETKQSDKPGKCPIATFDPLLQCMPVDPKYWDCRQDSECGGTQKCCESGPCGVKKCSSSVGKLNINLNYNFKKI